MIPEHVSDVICYIIHDLEYVLILYTNHMP